GIQSSARMEDYIRQSIPHTRFEELPTPFATVATDLHTGTPVVMSGAGDVALAVRASCALPGWYVPVIDEQGRYLVDGGLVANVPVSAARSLGADIVVAVDVNAEGARFVEPSQSIIGILLESLLIVQRTANAHQRASADIVILPKVGHIRWDEMTRADELIAAGEEATREVVEDIKRLIQPPAQQRLPLPEADPQTV
ncbi:MAG TPA: patatin-like phospholipase family protein, partial [Pyrinomonadaceae bacterium]|nr:patatin-like phospholipase family protein [Pyrinomonadaceae bacterium]